MVAWSYSVLDSFETCPWRHYLTKVAKTVREPQSPQMAEGNRVHKALELRVTERKPLVDADAKYEPLIARLIHAAESRGGQILAEQKLCLDENYQTTGYFSKTAWVRGQTDVTILAGNKAWVGDYKTGNPKHNSTQLRLTAAMTFATFPQVERIANTFIWLKTGETSPPEVFERKQAHEIWREFLPRVARLENAHATNNWPKKPSGLCRQWCPVGRHNCEHCGA